MTTPPAYTPQRLAWLTLRRLRGEEITYTAGDLIITGIVAVATRPDARQIDAGESLVINSRELDWLIDPDELVDTDGARVEPKRGATITRAKNGDVYKVVPTDGTDDTWRWSDPLETWRRINSSKK